MSCKKEIAKTTVVPYIGKGDMFEFGNGSSFASEKQSGREFAFTIKNASTTADKVVVLSRALYTAIAALKKKFANADVLLKDGTVGDITVEAHDPNNTLDEFIKYCQYNPTRIVHLALDSNDKKNFNFNIEHYQGVTPFEEASKEIINLRKFVTANQFQTDRVDIDLLANGTPLEQSSESVTLLKIAKNSELTVVATIGARASLPAHLRNRAEIAREFLASKGHA